VRDFADLEAEMRALADVGIRARMGHTGNFVSGPVLPGDLQRALDWIAKNGQGRLSLSMLLDGAGEGFPRQVRAARQLGLKTITDHGGFLAFPDLLGPEFLMTHGTGLTPEQIDLIAKRDIKVGLCPTSDPMIGAGLPPIYPLLMGGVPLRNISFTMDVTAQAPADPFACLRTIVNAGRIQQSGSTDLRAIAQARPAWKFTYRDAIELGTLSGANVLGIADQTGSLTPGKRADVIVVRKDDINMLPAAGSDVTMQLVQHGQPANVDTVFIDGQLRKQAGKLVGVDVRKVVAEAAAAQASLRERARIR
jgi:5-methylthioadenosine/S-adenosylhomocysteine deaminase